MPINNEDYEARERQLDRTDAKYHASLRERDEQRARAEKAEHQVKLWDDRMWATVPERAVWQHGNGNHGGPLPYEHCPECERSALQAKLDRVRELCDEMVKPSAECGEHEMERSEPELVADLKARGIWRPHYPDEGWSFCDGCTAAESADMEAAYVAEKFRAVLDGEQEGSDDD